MVQANRIELLMIDHTLHRLGLGTELLRHVEAELGQSHAVLQLESFAANEPANAFYRKHAWVEVSRHDNDGIAKVVFQKDVGPVGNKVAGGLRQK